MLKGGWGHMRLTAEIAEEIINHSSKKRKYRQLLRDILIRGDRRKFIKRLSFISKREEFDFSLLSPLQLSYFNDKEKVDLKEKDKAFVDNRIKLLIEEELFELRKSLNKENKDKNLSENKNLSDENIKHLAQITFNLLTTDFDTFYFSKELEELEEFLRYKREDLYMSNNKKLRNEAKMRRIREFYVERQSRLKLLNKEIGNDLLYVFFDNIFDALLQLGIVWNLEKSLDGEYVYIGAVEQHLNIRELDIYAFNKPKQEVMCINETRELIPFVIEPLDDFVSPLEYSDKIKLITKEDKYVFNHELQHAFEDSLYLSFDTRSKKKIYDIIFFQELRAQLAAFAFTREPTDIMKKDIEELIRIKPGEKLSKNKIKERVDSMLVTLISKKTLESLNIEKMRKTCLNSLNDQYRMLIGLSYEEILEPFYKINLRDLDEY
jgi:hypothetical protein